MVRRSNRQAYRNALKSLGNPKFAQERVLELLKSVTYNIEKVNMFLRDPDVSDKKLKDKIMLLLNLIDAKKKLQQELAFYQLKEEKSEKSLGELATPQ